MDSDKNVTATFDLFVGGGPVVFEELNVRPSVGYMRLVRNRPSVADGHDSEAMEEDSHHG